jgi:hypothetical protein
LPSQKKKRPRGVIDTSVLVAGIAAFKTPAPANLVSSAIMLRQWIENGTFTWLVNEEILDEYKANRMGESLTLSRGLAGICTKN